MLAGCPEGGYGADSELPLKPALPERRAKYDAVKARQAVQIEALARDVAAQKHDRLEDAFYAEAREAAAVRAALTAERPRLALPLAPRVIGAVPLHAMSVVEIWPRPVMGSSRVWWPDFSGLGGAESSACL